jgi:hypothetical protein
MKRDVFSEDEIRYINGFRPAGFLRAWQALYHSKCISGPRRPRRLPRLQSQWQMSELRDTVARAIQQANDDFYDRPDGTLMMDGPEAYYRASADAAIRATVEWLAAEADGHIAGQRPIGGQWGANWSFAASWLRSHLPASDPEVGDADT